MNPNITDTSPEAEAVRNRLIRQMLPERRLEMAVRMSNRLLRECKNAIRASHPELTDAEVGLEFIRLNYGQELFEAVKSRSCRVGR